MITDVYIQRLLSLLEYSLSLSQSRYFKTFLLKHLVTIICTTVHSCYFDVGYFDMLLISILFYMQIIIISEVFFPVCLEIKSFCSYTSIIYSTFSISQCQIFPYTAYHKTFFKSLILL